MLRERLLNKEGPWLLIVVLVSVTIMIMSVPASNLVDKNKISDESFEFGTINLDDRLDHIGLTFLQENTRHPETFAGSSKPSVMLYKPGEAERVKVEKITYVSIVSVTGTIYNGFKGRYMTYKETETLCLSKGAKMPWFEMIGSQFSEPVWIKSRANILTQTVNVSEEIGQEKLERLMNEFLIENAALEFYDNCNYCAKKNDMCLWPLKSSFINGNYFKRFVCKNETFDEKGRLIVFYDKKIFCEIQKLTAELLRHYQPSSLAFENITWISRIKNVKDLALSVGKMNSTRGSKLK